MRQIVSLCSSFPSPSQFYFLRVPALLPQINAASVSFSYTHAREKKEKWGDWNLTTEKTSIYPKKSMLCKNRSIPDLGHLKRETFHSLRWWKATGTSYHSVPAGPNLEWSIVFKTLQNLSACYHPGWNTSTDSVKWLKPAKCIVSVFLSSTKQRLGSHMSRNAESKWASGQSTKKCKRLHPWRCMQNYSRLKLINLKLV